MKLYKQYREVIDEIGDVEIAWFTTFNLDPELVERFLLPALIDKPPAELKTAEDYEQLNLELQERKIDIKVWYDYRVLNFSSRKQTTVPLIPFNPYIHYNVRNTGAVFHPKIIFLKGKNAAYIICGSANLSIGAWSSNCESIIIRKIETAKNANQVLDFFDLLGADVGALKNWSSRLNKGNPEWNFIYTNAKTNLITDLKVGDGKLTVWSPYFSNDLKKLASLFADAGHKNISLVPDRSTGKIRITKEQIKEIEKHDLIKIFISKQNENVEQFHHAKVWLTSEVIAVGSWNFSHRATGVGIANIERNIEAGIIENISLRDREKLNSFLIPYQSPIGTSAEELSDEWESLLSKYTFSCIIYADWNTFRYKTDSQFPDINYTVELPHNQNVKIPLQEIDSCSFLNGIRRILKDKSFRVYKNDELVFEGYLQEVNCAKRQAYGYISLQDALMALIENPNKASAQKRVLYSLNDKDDLFGEDVPADLFEYRNTDSYYTMFVAMQKLYELVAETKDLEDIGYRRPGSLQNIKTLVKESFDLCIHKSGNEKKEDDLLYHWFILNELNRCLEIFNVRMQDGEKALDSISLLMNEIREIEKILRYEPGDTKFMNLYDVP